jgi:hypothetical protein
MIRQYGPQRFRYETIRAANKERTIEVGTIPVGTIFRCQPNDGRRRAERSMMVEAWLPREIGAWRKVHGRYVNGYAARGGHLAQVRCLDTGERKLLADHFIRFCVDHV